MARSPRRFLSRCKNIWSTAKSVRQFSTQRETSSSSPRTSASSSFPSDSASAYTPDSKPKYAALRPHLQIPGNSRPVSVLSRKFAAYAYRRIEDVIPTGAQRSGGICCLYGVSNYFCYWLFVLSRHSERSEEPLYFALAVVCFIYDENFRPHL